MDWVAKWLGFKIVGFAVFSAIALTHLLSRKLWTFMCKPKLANIINKKSSDCLKKLLT
jgi:hypothetical protein